MRHLLGKIALVVSSFILTTTLLFTQIPPDPDPDSGHGPLKGQTECHNDRGKKSNCACFRECIEGVPQRDKRCGNRCHEDKCKCRSKCNS